MDKRISERTKISVPRYAPSMPPKNYSHRKAISLFCCIPFSYGPRCPEILRARITKGGDIYVMPLIEYLRRGTELEGQLQDFHLSYHSSGEFHWTKDGTHIEPLYGEADFRRVLEVWLRSRSLPCLCFRKGRGLGEEEILALTQCLVGYLPLTVDVAEAAQDLKGRNFYRLVRRDLR